MGIVSDIVDGLLISSAVANAVIGFVVLAHNRRLSLNVYFFGLSVTVTGWSITNILFRIVPLAAKYPIALLSYGFAGLLAVFFFLFSRQLNEARQRKTDWLVIVPGLIIAATASLPNVVATGVTSSSYIHTHGLALLLYGLILIILMGWGVILLLRQYRQTVDTERAKIQLILVGLIAAASIGLVCNLLLPLNGNYAFVAIGPCGSLAFVATTAYAIVRHRMFDIRTFVVRSLAYVLTLAILSSLFAVVVFSVAAHFVPDLHVSGWTQIYLSGATALSALTFSRLKNFFDRISNRLFYQDAYDTQELLDSLNRLFVVNTDLEKLLNQSAQLITRALKSDFCFFGIRESADTPQRIIGIGVPVLNPADIASVREMTPHIHHKLIMTEELDARHEKLRQILDANDIAILGRLTASSARTVEGLGYMVLGERRSGNPYTTKDVRVLEIIVNELVMAIENSLRFEEIRHFNETLQENVTEATRKLRRTNDKLQQLDATKDEFITMASHQLRTPLTSVKGYLSMVIEGDAGKLNAQQEQLLSQSYQSAQRMVFLISDLLNLSRLNTGKFVIESTPVDLREVVKAEIGQLAETAKSREVNLQYTEPESFPALLLDETKIHQVVMNFIDNAIYYTPAGGHITVSLKQTPSYVEYRVKDNGIGVPRAVQHRLFTKFYRADNAQRARPDGTGLGLFMAKKVIAAQGGSIIFESEEGKGSTFGFRFGKTGHVVPTNV